MDSGKEIVKADKKAFSIKHSQEEHDLKLAPYVNSEEMLSAAPMCVALLGHSLLITTDVDCSLEKEGQKFKHIRHPTSLRASLVQMVNMGWKAFQVADKRMDQIRLYSGQIPHHMKEAVRCLAKGSNSEIQMMLPEILNTVQTIADNCLESAVFTEKAFEDVIDLVHELEEACGRAEGEYDEKRKEATAKAKELAKAKMTTEQQVEEIKKEKEELEKKSDEALEKSRKAMKEMPGMGKLVALSIMEGITKIFTFGGPKMTKTTVTENAPAAKRKSKPSASSDFSVLIKTTFTAIFKLIEIADEEIQNSNSGKAEQVELLTELCSIFQTASVDIPTEDEVHQKKMESILKDGAELSKRLKLEAKSMNRNPQKLSDIRNEAILLRGRLEVVQLGFQLLDRNTPTEQPAPRVKTEGAGGITEAYIQQSYYKVEKEEQTWREMADEARERSERIEKKQQRITKIIVELERANIDEINFEQIKKLLKKAAGALTDVASEWGKLVMFFGRISNLVKASLHLNATSLKQKVEAGAKLAIEEGLKDFTVNTIYSQASFVNSFAHLVSHIATMYVDISAEYLLQPLSNLGELLALDSQTDSDRIKDKQSELRKNAEKASEAIRRKVEENRICYETKIKERVDRINKEFKCLLPPKPTEDPRITQAKMEELERVKEKKELEKASEDDDDDDDYLLLD